MPRIKTSSSLTKAAQSIAVVLIVVNANPAAAHPEFDPIATNRYLKLTLLSAGEVRLSYSVLYGAGPAQAARKAADANADGQLDEAETRAVGRALQAEVERGLTVTVDGQPARLDFEAPEVGFATGGNAVAADPFSIDLVARVACPGPPPHVLRLDDATALPALGETEVRVEESPATMLLASFRGRAGAADEKETRFVFRGPKRTVLEDRSVTVRFAARAGAPLTTATATATPPTAPAGSGRRGRWSWLILGLSGLVLLTAGAWARRRYRSMKG